MMTFVLINFVNINLHLKSWILDNLIYKIMILFKSPYMHVYMLERYTDLYDWIYLFL